MVLYREADPVKRKAFKKELAKIPLNHRIYMDESGIAHQISKDQSWSKRGERVNVKKSGARGRTNIIGAYKNKKLIATFRLNNSVDSDVFLVWLKECLLPCLDKNDVLIMDNASWHKTKKVQDFMKQNEIKYLYLSPYSPDLNPIEHLWAVIKNMMKNLSTLITDFYRRLDYLLCKY